MKQIYKFSILLTILILCGCGQKGPLYLPEPKKPPQPSSGSGKSGAAHHDTKVY